MNEKLKYISNCYRLKLLEISNRNKIAHLGSCLSCIDILTVLYKKILNIDPNNPFDDNRDRLLLSKGHAANSLYVILAESGFFSKELLNTIGLKDGLDEHPTYLKLPGIESSSGSLGHGLSIGSGISLAGKIMKSKSRTIVLMSDGECNEGSVWEAAMFSAKHKLNNLTAIIDFNKWQATGRSCDVMELQPLKDKWSSFGWEAVEIDGHDFEQLINVLSFESVNKPLVIIANTVKGKGISFMEDDNNWHYRIPTIDEINKAKKELELI